MTLTEEMIPLPSSNSLVAATELSFIQTIFCETNQQLVESLHAISRKGNAAKWAKVSAQPTPRERGDIFETVRNLWSSSTGVWCAIDLEGWEEDRSGKIITEFGFSFVHWNKGKEVSDMGHLIVKEHKMYKNGKYVADNRMNYKFGASKVLKRSAFRARIQQLISGLRKHGPLFLIFHDCKQDIKYLTDPEMNPRILAPIDGHSMLQPGATPQKGVYIVDTADLFRALEGFGRQAKSLENVCRALKISSQCLHNAGNDAHYTMLATMAMVSGGQIDTQRQQRWPLAHVKASSKASTSKAKLAEEDNDDDYDGYDDYEE
ncbi:hypothetical protein HGRIS_009511 [Hohenbuehelia grisea]